VVESKGKKKEYAIVGAQEANPMIGKISNESPLGKAFLGKKVGDTVDVEIPAGKQVFIVLEIK
jgi:transcription elongation factor GreA